MIVEVKQGQDILKSGAKHICFAVNTEGINDSGFAGLISRNHWPKLADIGVLSGANFSEIRRGMETSSKRIVLF